MALSQKIVLDWLKVTGAFKEKGHFEGTAGLHSGEYFEGLELLRGGQHHLQILCHELSKLILPGVQAVTGPPLGAIPMSLYLAGELKCLPVMLGKTGSGLSINRFFERETKGAKFLLADDFVSTGKSINQTIRKISMLGGEVIQVCAFVNRNPGEVTSDTFGGIPFVALANYYVESWAKENCPQCRDGVPLDPIFGHGG